MKCWRKKAFKIQNKLTLQWEKKLLQNKYCKKMLLNIIPYSTETKES